MLLTLSNKRNSVSFMAVILNFSQRAKQALAE